MMAFNIETNTISKIELSDETEVPEGRIGHAVAIIDDQIYLYGGESGDGRYLADIWRFSIPDKKWTQLKIDSKAEPPKPRSGHTMVAFNGNLFIFGGKTGNIHETNELWKIDLSKNQFELKHDTLLEQYTEAELKAIMNNRSQNDDLKKSPKNSTSNLLFKW